MFPEVFGREHFIILVILGLARGAFEREALGFSSCQEQFTSTDIGLAKGIPSQLRKYEAVLEFAQACSISKGTPVRIRGVTVGSVVRIVPTLKSVDAVVEMDDEKIIIPKNALVEVNQSGLLMETMIDITP